MPGPFRLGLAQCTHPADGDVLALVERITHTAAEKSVDLLVFPECLMTPFEKTREDFLASAQPLDGPFASSMAAIAAHHNMWIVFTMNERNEEAEKAEKAKRGEGATNQQANAPSASHVSSPDAPSLPFNTAVVVDSSGACRGVYRKTHLYDALSIRESDRMAHGDELFEPIDTPFCTLGLGICYDLRFPEVARAAALAGCELFVLPAAWVDGPHKSAQWKTLLAARAIENEMYVAGLSRADEKYVGESRVVNPLGETVAEASGKSSMLVIAEVDPAHVHATREGMPILSHRRPTLYTSLTQTTCKKEPHHERD